MSAIPSLARLRHPGRLPRPAVDLLLRVAAIVVLTVGILVILPELVNAAS